MKRIVLFVLTNVAIMVVLGVTASLFGFNRFLTANGLDLGALLGFSLIMGFGVPSSRSSSASLSPNGAPVRK